jgi:hypothetical protein
MLKRPPSDPARDRATKREAWRLAKRRQRARESDGVKRSTIDCGAVVIEALIAQAEDAGMTEEEAGRESRNRKKVAANLTDVVEQWALKYLRERARR